MMGGGPVVRDIRRNRLCERERDQGVQILKRCREVLVSVYQECHSGRGAVVP